MNEYMHEEDLSEILKVRREKLIELQRKGNNPFNEVKYEKTHTTKDIIDNFETMEGSSVSLAGRIMSKRGMGKVSFCDLQDSEGRIQLYLRIDEIGESEYELVKKLDIGDILGVKGEVFRTKRGEISIKVKEVKLLAKSLQPLPEKWHGLKDVDLRYRQRYVDLIVNPDVKEVFIKRSAIIKCIRDFLDKKGYIEVETPMLNTIPGGAAARPFITHHNTLDIDMYLRIATELHLKRLIVGGLEKVYEIGRIFRNEGMSIKHNPEFTTIELYEAYTDYNGIMELTEQLISYIAENIIGTFEITYQGEKINYKTPWTRMTMIDAVKKYTDIDFTNITSDKDAIAAAKSLNLDVKDNLSKGEIINLVFEEKVEQHLIQPTFILDYPVEVSPLAKRKADNPELTERFELFIYGRR